MNMRGTDDIELREGDFAWCLHCERVFVWNDQVECPYEYCDGSFLDFIPWEKFRQMTGKAGVPEVGKRYPMYG